MPLRTSRSRLPGGGLPRHQLTTLACFWLAALSGFGPPVWGQPTTPDSRAEEDVRIHDERLYEKSAKAAQAAMAYYGEYDNPEEKLRVHEIGFRLAAESDWTRFPFSFYLVDMPIPNAFALPGGHIFITRGMLDLELTDHMLACLLGHEIAHVIYEHGTKMRKRATLLNILSQAALLGVMIGMDDEPENNRDPYGLERTGSRKGSLVQGTAATGIVFTELLMRKFSRGFEDEADVEGQRLAAGAGFDPDGARALWQLMSQRIPSAESYGYWRTHPFSDQRLRAAEVRAGELKIQQPKPSERYRQQVQSAILAYSDGMPPKLAEHIAFEASNAPDGGDTRPRSAPEIPSLERKKIQPWDEGLRPFLERTALEAWPIGDRAEQIRLSELGRLKEREMEKHELGRDYGNLVRTYRGHIQVIQAFTPESPVLSTLTSEADSLERESKALLPKALEVWQGGVFQTPFLETFLSNYPDAEIVPEVALALGNAYSRSRRQSDAVTQYLRAMESGADTEAGQKALRGLRNLAPFLDDLVALQKLADDTRDEEVHRLSTQRLEEVIKTFKDLSVGAQFLKQYPNTAHAATVEARIEKLAQNLYGEVVLYQGLGDHVKALERIQQILEHAPLTAAAEALREKAILDDA